MSRLPLLLTPVILESARENSNLLILDLSNPQHYLQAHIPSAIHVHPSATQLGRPPAPGLLPAKEDLEELLEHIGLRDDHHVVTYDDEGGGWAGRMIWLLNSIGFDNCSLLSGGIHAWHDAGLPLSKDLTAAGQHNYSINVNPEVSVDLNELIELVDSNAVSVWDARSAEEFSGQRQTALRNGHIPGACHYEWTRAMDINNALKIRDLEVIRTELAEAGIDSSKEVVTHCHSHHRSGLTYLLGKALGFNIRAYPGSWSEWGNHPATPVK